MKNVMIHKQWRRVTSFSGGGRGVKNNLPTATGKAVNRSDFSLFLRVTLMLEREVSTLL